MTNDYADKVIHSFESRGEEAIREALVKGELGTPGTSIHGMAKEWLGRIDAARAEARDEETLSIARNARSLASRANTIAIIAMVLSVITAIGIAIVQSLTH